MWQPKIKDEPIEEGSPKAAIPHLLDRVGTTTTASRSAKSESPSSKTRRSREACHIRKLEDRVNQLEAQFEALQSRCDLALEELTGLKRKQTAHEDDSRKRAKPNVDTREPTLPEEEQGPAEAAERQSNLTSQEAEQEERVPFTGALASRNKTKADLMDVAQALRLTTTGTKKDLLERINAYFNAHPEKMVDPIFAGLFISGRRTTNDENSPIPSSTAPFRPYIPNPYAYHNNPSYPAHYFASPMGNSYPYYSYIGSPYNFPY